jgi:uncharacterized membrane protein
VLEIRMSHRSESPPRFAPAPVTLWSPLRWLALGWADLRRNPVPGLIHGFMLTAFGGILIWALQDWFWMLAGAFSGFLIVAPILVTGLYQVSRGLGMGRRVDIFEVMELWTHADGRLVRFGLLLGLAGTGWVLTSAGLITLWSPVRIGSPLDFLRHVVLARDIGLFEVWLLLGALLAAPVFASSVVAIPMLVVTSVPVNMAVAQSWRCVAENPLPMALWAVVIAMIMGVGALTALVGLVVLIPLLAHASWYAYCDLTSRQPTDHPLSAVPPTQA